MMLPSFKLFCGSREQFDRAVVAHAGRILGGVAYGATTPAPHDGDFPFAWVPMQVLGAEAWYEIWIDSRPVTVQREGDIVCTSDGHLLFGMMNLDESRAPASGLEAMAYSAYSAIFNQLDRSGYPELLRSWNYFARINEDGSEIERYREFNVGRHEAFTARGRAIKAGCVPAACALGTSEGNLVLGFLAGKQAGISLENPRQTSAWRYPTEFGPRSPTFSRGILVDGALLISGTASIVGSETLHDGNVAMQLEETLENLRSVIQSARDNGFAVSDPRQLYLNVYLRHERDYPAIRERLKTEFDGVAHIVYLQADVCRADLLVEIEAFWMSEVL